MGIEAPRAATTPPMARIVTASSGALIPTTPMRWNPLNNYFQKSRHLISDLVYNTICEFNTDHDVRRRLAGTASGCHCVRLPLRPAARRRLPLATVPAAATASVTKRGSHHSGAVLFCLGVGPVGASAWFEPL